MYKFKAIITVCILTFVSCTNSEDVDSQTVEDGEFIELNQGPIVEATSLMGDGLVRPQFDEETQTRLTENLQNAINNFNEDSDSPDNIIWIARHTAYLWRYQDAIYILTDGLNDYPENPKFYRHRGHRYITVREFDKAIADLLKARNIVQGQQDEIEEDGAPNAANIPVSTLHFNIHYHLGVAYYLNAQYDFAVDAFNDAYDVSRNPDTKLSAADWLYMSYVKNNQLDRAVEFINTINTDVEVLESDSYLNRIKLYKGLIGPDELLSGNNELDMITQGYGLALWYKMQDNSEKAVQILEEVLDTNYWAAFGYIAAEAELARLRK
ncbi:MAG TPA: hypothetical protein DCE78_12470 [Bacteroidetes bacterium]|nr:hypothetical protein [Bacteroidota bacterium]